MKKIIPKLIGFYLSVLAIFSKTLAGKKGYYIFSKVRPAPIKPYHMTFFATAKQSSFDHEGHPVHTYQWGHGPQRVLFLHGWQSHSFRWKKYVESFSPEEFTLYAIDAPGHGLSGGKYINLPLYSRAVQHFITMIQPVNTMIAHSFGGFALLHALFENSSLHVDRIVLMGVPGEAKDFISHYQRVLGLSDRAMEAALDYFKKELHHPPSWFSTARFVTAVKIPGLIIHDDKDPDAPYPYAVRVHELWPASTLITMTNRGHNLKGADIIEIIRSFSTEALLSKNSLG